MAGTPMKSRILVLNGSLGGSRGNTAALLRPLSRFLSGRVEIEAVHLAERLSCPGFRPENLVAELAPLLARSDGFVFSTGVYWDSWGSPLQVFLEQCTELEATEAWLGKPGAVLVSMHSVGGKEVLSRLQGVLVTLGMWIPPMSGLAYSLAGHLALERAALPGAAGPGDGDFSADFWQLRDLEIVGHNLLEALGTRSVQRPDWKGWPVDTADPRRLWLSDERSG